MTPEQRETKNQRDRERRAKMKAAGVKTLAELAVKKPAAKPRRVSAPIKAQPRVTAPEPGENMKVISFRGTEAQKRRFDELGGGAWVRDKIDRAA